MQTRPRWRGVCALGLLWAVGCGGPSPGTDVVPVQGKVFYKGQPLVTGTMVFTPNADRGSSGDLATAQIQPDGSYQVKCKDKVGAAAGHYRVTVMAVEMLPPAPGQPYGEPRSLLPARYSDPRLSGLDCEVKAGRDNTINFNLP